MPSKKSSAATNPELDTEEAGPSVSESIAARKRGRPTNGLIQFAAGHPLFESHIQRIRSKFKVPVPRRSPRPPPIKPLQLTEAWKKQAREYAKHAMVLFCPWKAPIEG